MPHPIPKGTPVSLQYDPKIIIQQRPQHAAGIGLVSAEWAALEYILTMLFGFAISGITNNYDSGRIAHSTIEALESLNARLTVISSVLKNRITNELYQEFKVKIVPDIRKRSAERNRVVHGHWQISDQYPDDVILSTEMLVQHILYSVKDFDEIASIIIGTSSMVSYYLRRIR